VSGVACGSLGDGQNIVRSGQDFTALHIPRRAVLMLELAISSGFARFISAGTSFDPEGVDLPQRGESTAVHQHEYFGRDHRNGSDELRVV
jgi:hypothetical protein